MTDRIRDIINRAVTSVEAIALAVALGGLITMGAVVAPAIFRNVPAPYSGDGMGVAFARYDQVAIAMLGFALLLEAARAVLARGDQGVQRWDRVRLGCVGAALAVAVFNATRITPAIAGLHAAGAMRGVGDLGLRLEAIHQVASRAGKLQVLFDAIALGMLSTRRSRLGA